MSFCKDCGEQIQAGHKFCAGCGASVSEEKSRLRSQGGVT